MGQKCLKNSLFFGMITEFLSLFSVLFMNLTNFLMKHQLMAMQIALTVVSKMKLGIQSLNIDIALIFFHTFLEISQLIWQLRMIFGSFSLTVDLKHLKRPQNVQKTKKKHMDHIQLDEFKNWPKLALFGNFWLLLGLKMLPDGREYQSYT